MARLTRREWETNDNDLFNAGFEQYDESYEEYLLNNPLEAAPPINNPGGGIPFDLGQQLSRDDWETENIDDINSGFPREYGSYEEYILANPFDTGPGVNNPGGGIPFDPGRQLTREEWENEYIENYNAGFPSEYGSYEEYSADLYPDASTGVTAVAVTDTNTNPVPEETTSTASSTAPAVQENASRPPVLAPKNWDDWRVRLHLAPNAKYLYANPEGPGIMYPLRKGGDGTNGIIFPYTPQINIQYLANYENYDLIHSNYRGYYYKNSLVQNLLLTATFTAQDTIEANYMLASLHFLRSCTKMFYGQDAQRGMPPPVVFLSGLGEYHFNNHPCVITQVNYNLPNDVDYIPAGVPENLDLTNETIFKRAREKATNPGDSREARLRAARLSAGGKRDRKGGSPAPTISPSTLDELTQIYNGKTYVPTKIDLNFSMLPIQTRSQVSNEFSLKDYATGELLKGGFW